MKPSISTGPEVPRPSVRAATLFLILLLALAGCAEGTVENPSDAGSEPDSSLEDADTSSNQTTPMDGGAPEDMSPCGVCCPDEVTCLDGTTVGVCSADGSEFEPSDCVDEDVCEEGACVTPPICTPGEKSCFDDETVLTCRGTGDGFTTSPCDVDTSCFEGECVTGNPTGSSCMTDDECASNQCHCGTGTDETCPSNATPGYCTAGCTDDADCGAAAYCMKGDFVPLGVPNANYDHCAPSCEAVCGDPTFGCIQAPHTTEAGEIEWNDTCFFDGVVEIGRPCTGDDQCIGECMEDYINDGYCSRRCDGDGSCPVGSECVELRSGEFWCSLLCGDGSVVGNNAECPRDVPVPDFSVSCQRKSGFEANTVFMVCAAN